MVERLAKGSDRDPACEDLAGELPAGSRLGTALAARGERYLSVWNPSEEG